MSRGSWNSVRQSIGRTFRHTTSRWRISCSSHAAPDLFVVVAVRRHLLDINGRERHVLAVSLTRRSQSNGGAIYTEVLAG